MYEHIVVLNIKKELRPEVTKNLWTNQTSRTASQ